MSIEQKIKEIIEAEFAPTHLEVINQSDNHIGHAGHDGTGQSHFKLIVVSEVFEGLGRVERSRKVNAVLSPLFNSGLHAISMKIYALSEYVG